MLNSKQKKFLRSEAHSLKPIFQVGKDGVGEKQINSINVHIIGHTIVFYKSSEKGIYKI